MFGDDCRRATRHPERRQNAERSENESIACCEYLRGVPTVIKPPSFVSFSHGMNATVAPQPRNGPTDTEKRTKRRHPSVDRKRKTDSAVKHHLSCIIHLSYPEATGRAKPTRDSGGDGGKRGLGARKPWPCFAVSVCG